MSDSYDTPISIKMKRIGELLIQDKRLDGRGLLDYREIKVETGIIDKANGSALVLLGKTKVMVGIKVESGTPFPDTPEEGVLTVNAELVPIASPTFETGPPGEQAVELARVVDRGIRESKSIDTKKLCIIPEKKVFIVFVDIYILDHDGNLFDAPSCESVL
jgi:exosome complex component RRP42